MSPVDYREVGLSQQDLDNDIQAIGRMLCSKYNLKSGDMTPHQVFALETLIKVFVRFNEYDAQRPIKEMKFMMDFVEEFKGFVEDRVANGDHETYPDHVDFFRDQAKNFADMKEQPLDED